MSGDSVDYLSCHAVLNDEEIGNDKLRAGHEDYAATQFSASNLIWLALSPSGTPPVGAASRLTIGEADEDDDAFNAESLATVKEALKALRRQMVDLEDDEHNKYTVALLGRTQIQILELLQRAIEKQL